MTVVALLQLDPTIGDFEGNTRRLLGAYKRAIERGATLCVATELCVCGYPTKDLLLMPAFLRDCRAAADHIAAETAPHAALVFGCALPNDGATDKPAYNAAIVAAGGKTVAVREKSLLPTYDVFDERRYFAPATRRAPVVWGGLRLGITICEDIWRLEFWPGPEHMPDVAARPYSVDPVQELEHAGIDLMLNISASPYAAGKSHARMDVVRDCFARKRVPVVYCNQVGGNDSLLFDGGSFVMDARGEVIVRAKSFEEDLVLWDMGATYEPQPRVPENELDSMRAALELGLKDYARKCGFTEVVIGLSGGIDSALTAALAVRALGPKNVHGVAMPSRYSSDHSLADAEELARNLGIDYRVIPIEAAFASFLTMLEPSFRGRSPDIAEENLQARIRGTLLMTLSNKFGWLVLSTGNKSEVAVGYSTLYGDSCGGLALIADVPKTDVYALSRHLNMLAGRDVIPASTLTKPPSAELRPDQFDADSLPPYEVLDPILEAYVEGHLSSEEIVKKSGADPALVKRILGMVDRAEYKRQQLPPNIRVSAKAFGYGRRWPIAQGWKP